MTQVLMNRPALESSCDTFARRHLGPSEAETREMLEQIGYDSMEAFIEAVIPPEIRLKSALNLPNALTEHALIADMRSLAAENKVFRSLIGMGYSDCLTPAVIQRNILENPGWYTQYTPYQAEIAQGRLEALLNFQTMIADMTALPVANASLLDEGTAAAEAMAMCHRLVPGERTRFLIADDCHPQTIAVVKMRAEPMGLTVNVTSTESMDPTAADVFGVLVQYPATDGRIADFSALVDKAHGNQALVVFATDLMALTMLKPPGEFGADIAIGNSQRFGVPLGYGGPHAAFISTREDFKRQLPGRIVGVSKDAEGKPAYRLAIQTREQHIRREKATSNICTAQVLLAIMAGMYATYHGPDGLRQIASRIRRWTVTLAGELDAIGHEIVHSACFDTLRIRPKGGNAQAICSAAVASRINLRDFGDGTIGIALDEKSNAAEVERLVSLFGGRASASDLAAKSAANDGDELGSFRRESDFLTHPVFNSYHSETEMMRYIYRLQQRDLSLATSMIPLGSCTMKLNAATEMAPVTWPEFGGLHPFAPADQAVGYAKMFERLEKWLGEITGLPGVSLQPNAGAQGEYAGLLVIRALHADRGQSHRDVCLIPKSAHGTNAASAVMAGMRVVPVETTASGHVDTADLRAKAEMHREKLAALMITYPSTAGVFEEGIRDICAVIHEHGGQVYMDGANMNAQVGLCRPGDIGADVCHLNLHKTFCIPHGGGGPGMGPICCASHLAPFMPRHPLCTRSDSKQIGPVSAAPYGSPSILPIPYAYIAMMGGEGLKRASQIAILNANYMARRLSDHYKLVFAGRSGLNAHEFIVDCRPFEKTSGIKIDDIAKRLIDFGFHAPTMSWPVIGTLMIEPTESESKAELDRFCDAMIAIREEIRAIEAGRVDRERNALKGAPHTAEMVTADDWDRGYSREQAAYPLAWVRQRKFWPAVARIDNAWGDRNLFCTCPDPESFA
ncbi:MAG: aminomethyl-transferring glycine dehydrogenase [Phycisphaerales bacterium]|nr:aminomethyl-transferring glycine dehydrogenase [Phycisphaerales bacterium]MCB9863401.1 aminomethyl-transferring glycine dehydrogenase [Phycisphaerales bacterium]